MGEKYYHPTYVLKHNQSGCIKWVNGRLIISFASYSKICFAAEVGLSGEIRAVNRIEQRISEAEKLGFEQNSEPYPDYGILHIDMTKSIIK